MTTDATAPVRATRQRAAIRSALAAADGFLSAQELHALLRSDGDRVGLTTVYRTLQSFADSGEVDALRSGDGEVRYRRCATARHHHHLVCRRCGRSVEVADRPVERWADKVAADHGFVDVTHQVEVFGVCPECAA